MKLSFVQVFDHQTHSTQNFSSSWQSNQNIPLPGASSSCSCGCSSSSTSCGASEGGAESLASLLLPEEM